MREALNCSMLPIVKDAMDGMVFNAGGGGGGMTVYPSNGYYGYQAHLQNKTNAQTSQIEEMEYEPVQNNNILRLVNRKRAWESNELPNFKKRRQNESVPSLPDQNPPQQLHLKKPTHNIPDIPRCIMGHYI